MSDKQREKLLDALFDVVQVLKRVRNETKRSFNKKNIETSLKSVIFQCEEILKGISNKKHSKANDFGEEE